METTSQENESLSGWFIFYNGEILIEKKADGFHIPFSIAPPIAVPEGNTIHTIGTINQYTAKTFTLSKAITNKEGNRFYMKDLRASYDFLPLNEYQMAGKASQILTWDKNSLFCPHCGTRQDSSGNTPPVVDNGGFLWGLLGFRLLFTLVTGALINAFYPALERFAVSRP